MRRFNRLLYRFITCSNAVVMNIPPPAIPPQANVLVILPDELIMEILSRLNVKSLMALKCVCKSWNTLISDPFFVKMHLNLSKRNSHVALLLERYTYTRTRIAATISVTCLLESTSNSIDRRHFRFDYIDCQGIVGSCNGLICLHRYFWDFGCQKHLFYFCNPATGTKSKTLLSLPWSHRKRHETFRFGFGYDNSLDTYKVVMLVFRKQVTPMVKVFTLGDNIWRDIQSFFPVVVVLPSSLTEYSGVYLSNSISWLLRKNLTMEQLVIISLDLGTETYIQLLLPSCCYELPLDNPTLCVLMDCICFSHDFKTTHLVIWQMKEFGVEESWTQFLKISYLDLGISHDFDYYGFTLQVFPLCLSVNDAKLILAARNQSILFNWRDNRVEKYFEKIIGIQWCAAKDYVESLVSTC